MGLETANQKVAFQRSIATRYTTICLQCDQIGRFFALWATF